MAPVNRLRQFQRGDSGAAERVLVSHPEWGGHGNKGRCEVESQGESKRQKKESDMKDKQRE